MSRKPTDNYRVIERDREALGDEDLVYCEKQWFQTEAQTTFLDLIGMRDLSDEIRREVCDNR